MFLLFVNSDWQVRIISSSYRCNKQSKEANKIKEIYFCYNDSLFSFFSFFFSFFRFFCFLFVFVYIYVPKQIHRRMWLSESRSKYIFFKNPNFRSRINFAGKYLEVKSTLYIVTLKIFLLNNISQVYFISHICSTWQGFSTSRFLVDQGFLRRSFTFTSFYFL